MRSGVAALVVAALSLAPLASAEAAKPKKPKPAAAKPAPKPAPAPAQPGPRSEEAARLIAWIAASHDNGTLPFMVIDKRAATLFLFDAKGQWIGDAPVLIGVGLGDDSSPGIGAKTLAQIGPAERTTPAGRYFARFGPAFGKQRVLWVDYAVSVALHAVITSNKKEKRLERLQSPTADDNRITFGCINVGTTFYTRQVKPLFEKTGGIVYILPDTRSLDDVFPNVRLLPYLQAQAQTQTQDPGTEAEQAGG